MYPNVKHLTGIHERGKLSDPNTMRILYLHPLVVQTCPSSKSKANPSSLGDQGGSLFPLFTKFTSLKGENGAGEVA